MTHRQETLINRPLKRKTGKERKRSPSLSQRTPREKHPISRMGSHNNQHRPERRRRRYAGPGVSFDCSLGRLGTSSAACWNWIPRRGPQCRKYWMIRGWPTRSSVGRPRTAKYSTPMTTRTCWSLRLLHRNRALVLSCLTRRTVTVPDNIYFTCLCCRQCWIGLGIGLANPVQVRPPRPPCRILEGGAEKDFPFMGFCLQLPFYCFWAFGLV